MAITINQDDFENKRGGLFKNHPFAKRNIKEKANPSKPQIYRL
jgi:hypothetical protein